MRSKLLVYGRNDAVVGLMQVGLNEVKIGGSRKCVEELEVDKCVRKYVHVKKEQGSRITYVLRDAQIQKVTRELKDVGKIVEVRSLRRVLS